MKKRTLCAVLALLMLIPALASCSESKTNTDETKPAETVSAPSAENEAETAPEEETEILPNIPALNFNGDTFTMLTSGPNDTNGVDWETYDIWVEAMNGDVINDAVFDRNLFLEDTYNVKIAEYKTNIDTLNEIKTEVKAGAGSFDAAMTHIENGANLAQQGNLYNLHNVNYIDTSMPWWDPRAVDELEIFGGLYFATGDITVIDNDATWVLMFNKQLREDLQLPNFYDLVREDSWTFDKFMEVMEGASIDLNGDGKMNYKDDQFSMITSGDSAYGLMYASGEKVATFNADGAPVMNPDIERLSGVVEKAAKIMGDATKTHQTGQDGSDSNTIRIAFQEGRGLFYGEVMQCIIRMRESETDFGLVPWPKYDETQKEYHNWIHNSAGRGVVIPLSQQNLEFAGAIVEAMAAKSMYTVTPAYYDVALTYKYMRDSDSAEMLDIILSSRIYDLGGIFNVGSARTQVGTLINGGKGDNLASTWKKFDKASGKMLEKIVKSFLEQHENGN